jgi:hypothetical protein
MRFLAVLFVFVLFAALTGETAPGQNLEETARKERQRRAKLKAPSRVYTNEDLNKSKPDQEDRASSENVLAPPARQEAELAGEHVELPEQDETVWSRRFSAARARLQEAEDQEKQLKDRLNELSYGCGPETSFDPYYFSYIWQRLEESQKAPSCCATRPGRSRRSASTQRKSRVMGTLQVGSGYKPCSATGTTRSKGSGLLAGATQAHRQKVCDIDEAARS